MQNSLSTTLKHQHTSSFVAIVKVSSDNKMRIFLFLLLATMAHGQGTRVGFYKTTCPRAESIVQSAVQSAVRADPTMAPGLLRLFFHDCFVNGCDASVLVDGPSTEKTAPPNLSLAGFKVIDAAKSKLETACPGVVSCADIVALTARDAVVLIGGRSWWVPLGRRDGFISRASDALNNLPAANDPISVQIKKFADKGLNTQDLVTLVGGHTIGTTGCDAFSYRLYNFNNTNGPDPTINKSFLPQLQALCPKGGDASRSVAFDTDSDNRFDNSYYMNLVNGRGVLESDAILWSSPQTKKFVKRYSGANTNSKLRFNVQFGKSMVKMGNTQVKTGSQGEIRRVCTAIN